MARAVHAAHDPAWTADGVIAETWMPVSPVTGRLDAFQWRVPVAELTPRGAVIEQAERTLQVPSIPMPPLQSAAPLVPKAPVKPPFKPADQRDGLPANAPDDPGPAPEPLLDPVPKPSSTGGKMRSWF